MIKNLKILLNDNNKIITGKKDEKSFTIIADMEYVTDKYETHTDSYWMSKGWISEELNNVEIDEVFKHVYIKYGIMIHSKIN